MGFGFSEILDNLLLFVKKVRLFLTALFDCNAYRNKLIYFLI
ncbi:hypothetical protein HMPREF9064_0306 [Aggregatibacter segnis ATCC 33393]|uniref:Uncharacterized protein n=1 Tax=Aggregatibacter segnis ATCC 33393 TaxID=888057 RepID=E6KVX4_9PAST|nr:hypothetical protein HMPREF9064_0306 [Aggregatibacter segnis ATCC 33393]